MGNAGNAPPGTPTRTIASISEEVQGVAQGELFLFGGKDVLALGGVAYAGIQRAGWRKDIGNVFADGGLEGGEVGSGCGRHWATIGQGAHSAHVGHGEERKRWSSSRWAP